MKRHIKILIGICVIAIIVPIGFVAMQSRGEGFAATSPGTMVQLRTSHVPTEEDAYYYKYVYPKLVRKEIYNMTESDLN
jgi:hypothetical protein